MTENIENIQRIEDKREWLLTQIAQFPTLSARELTGKLNEKTLVDNPLSQQQIPLSPSLEEVLAIVKEEEEFPISETKTYDRILEAISQGRIDWVAGGLATLKAGGLLSSESYDKLIALLQQTQPDPNYQVQINLSAVELAGYGIVLVNEVEELI